MLHLPFWLRANGPAARGLSTNLGEQKQMSRNLPLIIARAYFSFILSLFCQLANFQLKCSTIVEWKQRPKRSHGLLYCSMMMKPEVQPFSTIATACNLTWFSCLKVWRRAWRRSSQSWIIYSWYLGVEYSFVFPEANTALHCIKHSLRRHATHEF